MLKINLKIVWGIVALMLAFILAGGTYLIGNYALPPQIKSNYANKNCENVLQLYNFYSRVYPEINIESAGITGMAEECDLYVTATGYQGQEAWQDAYDAYLEYADIYPAGILISDVYERTAFVLTMLAKEQAGQGQYQDAINNLITVSVVYGFTLSSKETLSLIPEMYSAWGSHLRSSRDYVNAVDIYNEYQGWADTNQQEDGLKGAKTELAQTYLEWGLALQAEKQFDAALKKLGQAAATDPGNQSDTGIEAQARIAIPKVHAEWGNSLFENKEFESGIEHYKTAISLAEPKNQPEFKDILAGGYLEWAASLREGEDFLTALERIEQAESSLGTAAMKEKVEAVRADTYLAFSNSSGIQAKTAMQEAVETICKDGKKPSLPIFGINPENTKMTVYGIELELSDDIAATTPSSLYFVVCGEEISKILQTRHLVAPIVDHSAKSHWVKVGTIVRVQYTWNLTLVQTNTGNVVTQKAYEGAMPAHFDIEPKKMAIVGTPGAISVFGDKPDIAEILNWLESLIK